MDTYLNGLSEGIRTLVIAVGVLGPLFLCWLVKYLEALFHWNNGVCRKCGFDWEESAISKYSTRLSCRCSQIWVYHDRLTRWRIRMYKEVRGL